MVHTKRVLAEEVAGMAVADLLHTQVQAVVVLVTYIHLLKTAPCNLVLEKVQAML